MKLYIVTYAHYYEGMIHQNLYVLENREQAENVFDSYVEECYENTVGPSIMGDEITLDDFKRDNIYRGWEFDYETGDCTECYHVEIFEKDI